MSKTIGKILLELSEKAGRNNQEYYQVIYIEGIDEDWKANKDAPDFFNDLGVVIRLRDAQIVHSGRVTTEPGGYYTEYPLNPAGCARLAFGYYHECWTFGDHKGQDALVQRATVKVRRDSNKDGLRTGDKLTDAGAECGINQHTTSRDPNESYNPPRVGKWSAGCIVWQNPRAFRKYINLLRETPDTTFSATLLDGNEVAKAIADR